MRKKVALSVVVLVVLVTAGVFTAFAMQKEVTVSFNDGKEDILAKTWNGTLEEVLADTDLDIEELKDKYEPSVAWDQAITEDVHIDMTRVYAFTLIDGGEKSNVETKLSTVGDFFKEHGLILDDLDEVNVPLTSPIKDDMKIIVDRIVEKVKKKKESIPFDTVKKEDANLEKGKEILAREGKEGKKVIEVTYVYKNGELIDKSQEIVEEKDPVDKLVNVGTKEKQVVKQTKKKSTDVQLASRSSKSAASKPASSANKSSSSKKSTPSAGVWDSLAACESGGNWSANTGNGYYGGLQFSLSTWRSLGGKGYPHEASRDTQISMAKKLQARQGWGAWGACSAKLGLN